MTPSRPAEQQGQTDQAVPGPWSGLWGAGILTWCLGAFFASGELTSVDEVYSYQTVRALVERATLTIEPVGDRTSSRYSPLVSLWSVPFFAAYRLAAGWLGPDEGWAIYSCQLGSVTATALAIAILCRWASELSSRPRTGVAVALLAAVGSLLLPYSGNLFGQVAALPWMVWLGRSVDRGYAKSAAVALALLGLTRAEFVVLVVPIAISILWDRPTFDARLLIGVTMGGAVAALGQVVISSSRGDSLLVGSYLGEAFITPIGVGLMGLLFSFGKGLLWFSPAAFVGLIALVPFARCRPWPGRMILLMVATQVVMTACWWTWHGGWSWGPRLLLPILPLCFVPYADLFDRCQGWSLLARRTFGLCIAVSIAINLWAAAEPEFLFHAGVYSEPEAIYLWDASPWAAEWQPPSAWLWKCRAQGIAQLVSVALVALAGAALWSLGRNSLFPLRPFQPTRLGSVLLLAVCVGQWPTIRDLLTRDEGTNSVPAQYRRLEKELSGGRLSGRLIAPIHGEYEFFRVPPLTTQLHVDGKDIFRGSEPSRVIDLRAGEHEVRIRFVGPRPEPIYWTIPGGSDTRRVIPNSVLLPSRPRWFDRIDLYWRQWSFVYWIVVSWLFAYWITCPDRAPVGTAHSTRGSGS